MGLRRSTGSITGLGVAGGYSYVLSPRVEVRAYLSTSVALAMRAGRQPSPNDSAELPAEEGMRVLRRRRGQQLFRGSTLYVDAVAP